MSNRKTVAILGVSNSNAILLAKYIAREHAVLLFDTNQKLLSSIYAQLLLENPNAQAEPMCCPTYASWEADIIVVSANALANEPPTQQIRKVSTGKIVLVLESITDEKNKNSYFEILFPFSKVISCCEEKADAIATLSLKGNDVQALATLVAFFTTIGLKINVIFPSTINA